MIKEVENNTISSAHSRSQSSTSRFRDYLILGDDDDDYRWPACPYPCPHLHIKALTRPGEAYIAPGICLPGHILHQQAYAYIAMPAYTRFLGAYTAVFMGSATRYKVSLFWSWSSFNQPLKATLQVTCKKNTVIYRAPLPSPLTSSSSSSLSPSSSLTSAFSSSPSSQRVATDMSGGARGHSGDFMATRASSIDLNQSFHGSGKLQNFVCSLFFHSFLSFL